MHWILQIIKKMQIEIKEASGEEVKEIVEREE